MEPSGLRFGCFRFKVSIFPSKNGSDGLTWAKHVVVIFVWRETQKLGGGFKDLGK